MTIRKFLPPIHIHPILIIFIIISFLTGTFLQLFIILSIVLIHEFGHFVVAKLFKWRIQGIILWIFGGVMDTDEHGNKPLYEDVLVTIAGPLQHLFIYLFIYIEVNTLQIIPEPITEMILLYNTMILMFNLLPIWPLDGGKIVFFLFSKYLPFRKAYDLILAISMIACLLIILSTFSYFSFNLSVFLVMIFIFKENWSEWKKRYYVFIRFLLRRYEGESSIKEVRPINVSQSTSLMDVFTQFHRNKKHSIYIIYPDNTRALLDENDCLRFFFYDKQVHANVGDLKNHYI